MNSSPEWTPSPPIPWHFSDAHAIHLPFIQQRHRTELLERRAAELDPYRRRELQEQLAKQDHELLDALDDTANWHPGNTDNDPGDALDGEADDLLSDGRSPLRRCASPPSDDLSSPERSPSPSPLPSPSRRRRPPTHPLEDLDIDSDASSEPHKRPRLSFRSPPLPQNVQHDDSFFQDHDHDSLQDHGHEHYLDDDPLQEQEHDPLQDPDTLFSSSLRRAADSDSDQIIDVPLTPLRRNRLLSSPSHSPSSFRSRSASPATPPSSPFPALYSSPPLSSDDICDNPTWLSDSSASSSSSSSSLNIKRLPLSLPLYFVPPSLLPSAAPSLLPSSSPSHLLARSGVTPRLIPLLRRIHHWLTRQLPSLTSVLHASHPLHSSSSSSQELVLDSRRLTALLIHVEPLADGSAAALGITSSREPVLLFFPPRSSSSSFPPSAGSFAHVSLSCRLRFRLALPCLLCLSLSPASLPPSLPHSFLPSSLAVVNSQVEEALSNKTGLRPSSLWPLRILSSSTTTSSSSSSSSSIHPSSSATNNLIADSLPRTVEAKTVSIRHHLRGGFLELLLSPPAVVCLPVKGPWRDLASPKTLGIAVQFRGLRLHMRRLLKPSRDAVLLSRLYAADPTVSPSRAFLLPVYIIGPGSSFSLQSTSQKQT